MITGDLPSTGVTHIGVTVLLLRISVTEPLLIWDSGALECDSVPETFSGKLLYNWSKADIFNLLLSTIIVTRSDLMFQLI